MANSATKTVGRDLTQGALLPALVAFAAPMVLTNIIQQLYGLVDLIIIGRYLGSTGTVAVSTGGEIADFFTMLGGGFGAAAQIYIAQLVGAGAKKKLKEAMGTTFSVMALTSIAVAIAVFLFHKIFLQWLNCPAEAYRQSANYMIITAIGFPFIFGYNALCGMLRGMGESAKPLMFIIIAACTNVVLDWLLVVPLNMEAAGAAIATVISQLASFVASFIYIRKHNEQFGFEISRDLLKIRREPAVIIMKLALPQTARSFLVRSSILFVNSSINSFGLLASATNSVGNKLQTFLEVYVGATQQACAAMIGQNLGAKKHDRAQKTVWYGFSICMCFAAITAIVINIFPKAVFGIFTGDAAVLDMGVGYLGILTIHLFMSAFTSTLQSMVLGTGFASLNFVIGVLDGVVCKIGLGLIFAYVLDMGIYGFWWGTALSRFLPGCCCLWYLLSGKWKTRKLLV
ncbi:MAG: MATE family efflux transporter [Clostridiales bacterium]|jgi:putative MATE family efflux protein|nr:MATE family efflux transporter [Clostridiales bacterium]